MNLSGITRCGITMQISLSRKPVRSYTPGYYVGLVWPKITFLKFIDKTCNRICWWQGCSDVIERVQRRALRKIYPVAESYTVALQLPNLKERTREIHDFCVKSYMDKMKYKDHPLYFLFIIYPLLLCITCKTKRADHYFTFRYFN